MGVSAQLTPGASPVRRGARRGAALPTAIFGLVVLSVLGAGIYSIGSVQRQATFNRESTTRALLVAEEGLAHGVAVVRDTLRNRGYTTLLQGSDNTPNTADDGRLLGFNLGSGLTVPVAGRTTTDGTFTIQILDDPADPVADAKIDGNYKLIMRCVGTTPNGASATIDVIFGAQPMPAMAVDGSISMAGTPDVIGACGGVHANSNLTIASGSSVTSTGTISATGTVTNGGTVTNPSGTMLSPLAGQESIEIPSMSSAEFCPRADYDLRADGTIYERASGFTWPAVASAVMGWRRTSATPVIWTGAAGMTSGTWCVAGNADIGGNVGSAVSPLAVSVIATGSIRTAGRPFFVPDTEDYLFIADGDIYLAGNSDASNENFEGVVYAGAQCRMTGTARTVGQIMCKNGAQPTGAADWVVTNQIDGSPEISYGCGTSLTRRKILDWIQVSN